MTDWKELAERKKAQRDALLPKEWLLPAIPSSRLNVIDLPKESGLLTPRELEITELDVVPLLKAIADSTYTAVEVCTAFCKRACIAHQAVNCLTEILFDSAIKQAKELDAHLKKTGKVVGPLHGLPVSLKDQIQINDVECTMGFASWVGQISEKDAVITKILRDAGAVFHCKTNVPQTLQRGETDNFVFGRTVNPHNRNLTCGGSSGGEGALHAMRGALLGIGSDIGGSVRIREFVRQLELTRTAAACNGTYALHPTMRRTPYRGTRNFCEGAESIESVLGPMGTSLDGITYLFKAIIDGKPHELDPTSIEMPWRQDQFELKHISGKLCFGVMRNNGNLTPLPPCQRALEGTVQALRKAGHEIIEFEAADLHLAINSVVFKLWLSDGGQDFKAITAASGEPKHWSGPSVGSEQTATSAYGLMLLNRQRDELRAAYLERWQATASRTSTGRPMDALLCHPLPSPAALHEKVVNPFYTSVWNGLDYPAVVLPVRTTTKPTDTMPTPASFFNETDAQHWQSYEPNQYKDAPLSVQLVGRRHREEELLGIARVVDTALA